MKLDIHCSEPYLKGEWYAYDMNTYDGAPDGNNQHGCGKTKWEAIRDLIDTIEDDEDCPKCGWGPIGCASETTGCRS